MRAWPRRCARRRRRSRRPGIDWGRFARDHAVIRDSIERVVPGSTTSTTRSPARRVRPPARPARRPHVRHPRRVGPSSPSTSSSRSTPARHAAAADVRSHDQYNTTIYGLDDRYRGIHSGRRVVFVSRPDDLAAAGLARRRRCRPAIRRRRRCRAGGAPVPRSSSTRRRPARVPRTTRRPTCSSRWTASNAAGTPTFKSIPIDLSRSLTSATTVRAWRRRARPRGRRRAGCVNVTRSPVAGWSKASSAACRNGRVSPSIGRRWL